MVVNGLQRVRPGALVAPQTEEKPLCRHATKAASRRALAGARGQTAYPKSSDPPAAHALPDRDVCPNFIPERALK